jgi:hypothetical protein
VNIHQGAKRSFVQLWRLTSILRRIVVVCSITLFGDLQAILPSVPEKVVSKSTQV